MVKLGLIYIHKGGIAPPLGLMSIATYLRQNFRDDCLDIKIIDVNFDDILSEIKKNRFDILGLGAMTIEYKKAILLAQEIKKIRPNLPIIIGGVHISTLPSSLHHIFDFGVIGEGEETLLEILKLYHKEKSLPIKKIKKIKGLVIREKNKLIVTTERPLIEPLDKLPVINRRQINKKYFAFYPLATWGEFGREFPILTSRGCPYHCTFCSTRQFWKKVRYHSIDHVIKDIKDLIENYGVTHIIIWDDLFTIDIKRLKEMARRFEEEGINKKVKFNCQTRANLINEEMCQVLKSLNVRIVMFGFESGSDKTLNLLKAGTVKVSQNKKAIKLCVKNGFKVQGSVIFGVPGETVKEMKKTIDFLKFALKSGAERLWSFVLTPFPATIIWDIAKKRGKVSDDMDWEILSHQGIDNPLCLDDNVDKGEFKKIFLEGRTVINSFKWRKIFSFLKDNPFLTVYYFFKKPWSYFSYLFTKRGF